MVRIRKFLYFCHSKSLMEEGSLIEIGLVKGQDFSILLEYLYILNLSMVIFGNT